VLEIGSGQGRELSQRARNLGWKRVAVHQDLAGHDRVLMALG
jgi:release factor glutamine methyltransferase